MKYRTLLLSFAVILMMIASINPAFGKDNATIRPISEFVAAQGTYCIDDGSGGCFLFVPPIKNLIGWASPGSNRFALIDYTGVAAQWLKDGYDKDLGTVTSGTVLERPLPDGRAQVSVLLHTSNALAWAIDGFDFAGGPLIFGHRAPDVAAGAEPGLADCLLQVEFKNTAPGAPLPDILQLFFAPEPGQEVRVLSFRATASGPLRAYFGVPEGTPGRLVVTQTGLFMTKFKGATADGFPAERVDVHVIGE
jgi:hypothetical protein